MSTIILQFAAEHTILSWMIRWYDHSPWSHVDIVLPDGRLLGARFDGGVLIRAPGYANFSRTDRVFLDCADADRRLGRNTADEFISCAYREIGKPYDFKGIIGFVTNRDWRNSGKWFCSELAARMLEPDKSGFLKWMLASPADRIDPNDLYIICRCFTNLSERTLR